MKEFNYKRAWREYVKPEFEKLSDTIKQLFVQTASVVDSLSQDRTLALVDRTLALVGQTPDLVEAYDAVPAEELIWAAQVVYYYGHLAPDGTAQSGGLYWKFQKLADDSVIKRDIPSTVVKGVAHSKPGTYGLLRHKAQIKMDEALKAFHDHKEGTEYNDEEAGEILAKVAVVGVSVLKVDHVNHTPDIFCIGPKHFKSDSMYLDPNVAPCANCGRPYSEHTSDRVAFVKVHNPEDKDQIQGALKSLLVVCETSSIKIDGFALVK